MALNDLLPRILLIDHFQQQRERYAESYNQRKVINQSIYKPNTRLLSDSPKVSLSAFAFLFAEVVKYSHHNEKKAKDVERRLSDMGFSIGIRLLEHISWKEKSTKRETKMLRILFFISSTVWKALFGREASLEQTSNPRQYIISEQQDLLVSKFISVPKAHPNSNHFVAGIVEGMLDAAEFPATVTAPNPVQKGGSVKHTIFIDFNAEVVEEDAKRT